MITPVIVNFEVGRMLVDTESSEDILFLDAYLKLGMSWAQIRPMATPLVGFTGNTGDPRQPEEGIGMLLSILKAHLGPDGGRSLVEEAGGALGLERVYGSGSG
ncbi:hypothetical protein LIER_13263 [Lithospermum erythrorhizon]|uniref:Uncharacterized protein n=1 Tax=Lithospermum erythrorhizon TaxID=34254 RepID=A0AAV3PWT0_LITER